jgi:hypothetical protein
MDISQLRLPLQLSRNLSPHFFFRASIRREATYSGNVHGTSPRTVHVTRFVSSRLPCHLRPSQVTDLVSGPTFLSALRPDDVPLVACLETRTATPGIHSRSQTQVRVARDREPPPRWTPSTRLGRRRVVKPDMSKLVAFWRCWYCCTGSCPAQVVRMSTFTRPRTHQRHDVRGLTILQNHWCSMRS